MIFYFSPLGCPAGAVVNKGLNCLARGGPVCICGGTCACSLLLVVEDCLPPPLPRPLDA